MYFLTSGMALFALTLVCKTLVNMSIIREIFFLAKTKVQKGRWLLAGLLIALIELVPMVIGFSFYPGNDMNEILYCLLYYPCPVFLLLYYPIFRKILKAPVGMMQMALEWMLLAQYALLVIYAMLCNLWAGILGENVLWNDLFIPDYIALVFVAMASFVMMWIMTKMVKNTKHFYELPYNYVPDHLLRTMVSIFISTTTSYVMLVSIRLIFWHQTHYRQSFNMISLLVFSLLLFLQIYDMTDRYYTNRRKVIEWQAKQAELYIQSMQRTTAEFRQIKHDFYNILQTYGGYISLADLNGLQQYHESLTQTTVDAGTNLDILQALRGRMPLYSLLDIKKNFAAQHHVKFQIIHISPLAKVSMSDFDLCRILSNLLDNAIEASAESTAREVTISAQAKENEVVVQIYNSTQKPVDTELFFQNGYTTKPSHGGQGLSSVKNILNHYRGCSIQMHYAGFGVTALLRLPLA